MGLGLKFVSSWRSPGLELVRLGRGAFLSQFKESREAGHLQPTKVVRGIQDPLACDENETARMTGV
jgi:hypothetical protein